MSLPSLTFYGVRFSRSLMVRFSIEPSSHLKQLSVTVHSDTVEDTSGAGSLDSRLLGGTIIILKCWYGTCIWLVTPFRA